MDVLVDGEIVLFGTVGDDFWMPGFTARDVVNALAEIGRGADVTVRVNSGGGYTDDGIAIFNALKAHRGKVTVIIEALAASAASAIAMAGDEVIMRTGSLMMIHDPSGVTIGTSAEHRKSIEWLEHTAAALADIYAEKTGRTPEQCRADMREEIWLSPDEAIAQGYADKVDSTAAIEPTAFDYRIYAKAPDRLVALADAKGWNSHPRAGQAPRAQQRRAAMAKDNAAAGAAAGPTTQPPPAADPAPAPVAGAPAGEAGAAAERERVIAILADPKVKGRERAALDLAMKSPAMSAADIAAFVEANVPAADAGGAAFAERMARIAGETAVGATDKTPAGKASIDAAGIYASRAAAART